MRAAAAPSCEANRRAHGRLAGRRWRDLVSIYFSDLILWSRPIPAFAVCLAPHLRPKSWIRAPGPPVFAATSLAQLGAAPSALGIHASISSMIMSMGSLSL